MERRPGNIIEQYAEENMYQKKESKMAYLKRHVVSNTMCYTCIHEYKYTGKCTHI